MIPSSWTTMQCPDTLAVEKRKVAKTADASEAEKRKASGDQSNVSDERSNKVAKLGS